MTARRVLDRLHGGDVRAQALAFPHDVEAARVQIASDPHGAVRGGVAEFDLQSHGRHIATRRHPTLMELATAQARFERRARAAVQLLFALALGVAGAFALLAYLTPCEAGHLCSGAIGLAGRRVRAGSSAPPPWFTNALREARTEGYAEGERTGYVAGWRWGVVCGATAGLLAGALLISGALSLGLITGGI